MRWLNKLFAPPDRREKIHFLHIGKTGGTAIKTALQPHIGNGRFNLVLHEHAMQFRQLPSGERAIFFLRDPLTRFVSGFNSRLRQGQPRYFWPWSPAEKILFGQFTTPNQLALALAASHADEQAAAEHAMRSIQHVRDGYSQWFGTDAELISRLPDVFFIGFQETLAHDFEKLKSKLGLPGEVQLPTGEVNTHKTPAHFNQKLEPQAVENLTHWYRDDIRFYQLCQKLVAEGKID